MTKLSDKLTKVNDSFTVYRYDNGFMIEVSGRDSDDDYKTSKILCNTLNELTALVIEASNMELVD